MSAPPRGSRQVEGSHSNSFKRLAQPLHLEILVAQPLKWWLILSFLSKSLKEMKIDVEDNHKCIVSLKSYLNDLAISLGLSMRETACCC